MRRSMSLTLASLLVFAAAAVKGQATFSCIEGTEMTSNPLGTGECDCTGHLWVENDCTEGYVCYSPDGDGCYLKCAANEILLTNFVTKEWACWDGSGQRPVFDGQGDYKSLMLGSSEADTKAVPGILCPGVYDTCPNVIPAIPPTPTPTENPLGLCHCENEIWIADGCSYGWQCDANTNDNTGEYIICDPGEVILTDRETLTWSCSDEPEWCPGNGYNIGCPVPLCTYARNPLGTCECDQELFIGPDCTNGFYCMTNIPDPYLYDGCVMTCLDNQYLLPHFESGTWECIDKDDAIRTCPGKFNIECAHNDVGTTWTGADCECENGEFIVSADCRHGFWCHSRTIGGGRQMDCGEGNVVAINRENWTWECQLDVGQCPGGGGFRLGCDQGAPPPVDFACTYGVNTIGSCEGCSNQIFIGEDCTRGFLCTTSAPGDEEGCAMDCPAGQQLWIDPIMKDIICKPENEVVCPGDFHIDCPDDFGNVYPICGCENEVWVNRDCTAAFYCSGLYDVATSSNPGFSVVCPEDKVLHIDFHNPNAYSCVDDVGQCPGSFHFGCDGQSEVTGPTMPPTSSTEAPTDVPPPASGASALVSGSLAVVLAAAVALS